MSNEGTSDKGSEKQTNRRQILQTFGATAGSVSLGAFASKAVSAKNSEQDISVVDVSLETATGSATLDGQKAYSNQFAANSPAVSHPKVSDVVEYMEEKTELNAERSSKIYVDIQTDNEEANGYDPRASVIPFGSNDETNGAGFLIILTSLENGDQVPIGLFGITATEISSAETPGAQHRRQTFGLQNGNPIETTSNIATSTSSTGPITTLDTIPCSACQVVVDGMCAGIGLGIGTYGCVAGCVAAFNANFIAAFSCATICRYLASAITAVGCTCCVDKQICIYAQNHSPVDFGC